MLTVDLASHPAAEVEEFQSSGAEAAELVAGQGEVHVHVLRIRAGGAIGTHEAGFDQLFVVVSGAGWLSGPGGRVELAAGQAGRVRRGEMHSKGATTDMVALIVQVTRLGSGQEPDAPGHASPA